MKKLILIRHAKSSWDMNVSDRERALDARGISDAGLVSAHCADYMPRTFIVWCSPARRTLETAAIFAAGVPFPADDIIVQEDLYTFDASELERAIGNCDPDIGNLVLFGHNEAITDFVRKFGDVSVGHIPACGFVAMTFGTAHWHRLPKGKIDKTLFPKQLRTN